MSRRNLTTSDVTLHVNKIVVILKQYNAKLLLVSLFTTVSFIRLYLCLISVIDYFFERIKGAKQIEAVHEIHKEFFKDKEIEKPTLH